jgi:hypothetical protein
MGDVHTILFLIDVQWAMSFPANQFIPHCGIFMLTEIAPTVVCSTPGEAPQLPFVASPSVPPHQPQQGGWGLFLPRCASSGVVTS